MDCSECAESRKECAELRKYCTELEARLTMLQSQLTKVDQRLYAVENQGDPSKVALQFGDAIVITSRDEICNGTPLGSVLHTAFNGRIDVPYGTIPLYSMPFDLPNPTVVNTVIVHYLRNKNIFLENAKVRYALYDDWRIVVECANRLGMENLSTTITENIHRWIVSDFIEEANQHRYSKYTYEKGVPVEPTPELKFEKLMKLPWSDFHECVKRTLNYNLRDAGKYSIERLFNRMDIKGLVIKADTKYVPISMRTDNYWIDYGKCVLQWFIDNYSHKWS